MGLRLYKDNCKDEGDRKIKKRYLFRIWLHCCRRARAVTLEQLIALAPYWEDYLRHKDRFYDEDN